MKLKLAIALSILLVILFIGTAGAFLFYVPALSVFAVSTVLLGFGLMFALGLYTGRQMRKLTRGDHGIYFPGRLHA